VGWDKGNGITDLIVGLGNAWLAKSQFLLAKIHREESAHGYIDDASAERRLQNPDYVEVRGLMQVCSPPNSFHTIFPFHLMNDNLQKLYQIGCIRFLRQGNR
jgi:hypothetical protein